VLYNLLHGIFIVVDQLNTRAQLKLQEDLQLCMLHRLSMDIYGLAATGGIADGCATSE